MTTDPQTVEPTEPDDPAAYALARHIADHPVSTIQAAFRYLNTPLTIELREDPAAPEDRGAVLREAADLIEARQDRLDAEERAEYVNLDHETVLQGEAVRGMAAYLRKVAAETPGPETQAEAHPAHHTWEVESPRRDNWASWGTTYDERDWAQERYESAIGNAPARPFRLVRATTTYAVEAEHAPATAPAVVAEPGKECAASISGNCLAEAQSETGCATEDGECVHAGQPGKEA